MRHVLGRDGRVQNVSSDVCGRGLRAEVEDGDIEDGGGACGSEGTGATPATRCAEKSFSNVSPSRRHQYELPPFSQRGNDKRASSYCTRCYRPACHFGSASTSGCRGGGTSFPAWSNCPFDGSSRTCRCRSQRRDGVRGREVWGCGRSRVRWAMRSMSRRVGRWLRLSVCVCKPLGWVRCGALACKGSGC